MVDLKFIFVIPSRPSLHDPIFTIVHIHKRIITGIIFFVSKIRILFPFLFFFFFLSKNIIPRRINDPTAVMVKISNNYRHFSLPPTIACIFMDKHYSSGFYISRANVFDLHKSLINFSTRPRFTWLFTKPWANRSISPYVTTSTNFQNYQYSYIWYFTYIIEKKLLFIASPLDLKP